MRSSQGANWWMPGSGVFTCIIITSTLLFASKGFRPVMRWKAVMPKE